MEKERGREREREKRCREGFGIAQKQADLLAGSHGSTQ